MKLIYSANKESGVVSILSVIFFIILMSILTVSFLRLVTDEQNQVIDDDLSRGALASAQSGVEDAKRALLYCRKNPTFPACADLTSQTCPGMFSNTAFDAPLGLNRITAGNENSIQVGDPTNNQRYTCVTVQKDTSDYQGSSSEESMQLIPLRGISGFNQIRFSWRQVDTDPAPIPTLTEVGANTNPRRPHWENAGGVGYLAVPRLQIFNFDDDRTLDQMRDNSLGMYLYPYTGGTGQSTINASSITPGGLGSKRVSVNCDAGPVSGYRCTATINIPAPDASEEYYLAVKSVYGPTVYKVELLNNGTPVLLNDVQPEVDSTGAAANVFKRVISRVSYELDPFLTTNVVESGAGICKDFVVTRTTVDETTTNCLGF